MEILQKMKMNTYGDSIYNLELLQLSFILYLKQIISIEYS